MRTTRKSACSHQRRNGRAEERTRLLGGLLACLALLIGRPCAAGSIRFARTTAAGVPLMVLTVDLNNPNVKVTGMVVPPWHAEPFESMIRRAHPTAALTGTYFCERTLVPIGDIVVDGRLAHRGGMGTGLCITDDNQCEIIKTPRYRRVDWSAFDFVCCAGPRLVCAGKVALNPWAEGFRDSRLYSRAARLAVGVTEGNHLIFAATRRPITLRRLAMAMQALGCMDAINLDAGSSLGLYYNAKVKAHPHRKLTNLILIYDDRQRYERFKHRLTPLRPQTASR
ncbi:MAG TPA: phosphodiester glycosidase family protein [Chthonomonadaceae bacterium]|nr:phosphodiester glycosidase family protein [Chthonomonadaceae bacterium]